MSNNNVDIICAYLNDLASGVTGQQLAAYFTTDVVQIEFPNRLNPRGGRSDLATLLTRAEGQIGTPTVSAGRLHSRSLADAEGA